MNYPVCGPREPVYALMRSLGLSESKHSDKRWLGADGLEVQIYGAGSMARIKFADAPPVECELGDLGKRIDALRRQREPEP